ncbi:MAG: hypothetical protein EXS08_01290 [Planctomycetes bacterium]|nr:hypothetical protein [Planctomycetota bacterium]
MSARLTRFAGALLAWPAAQAEAENRQWYVELELVGPCAAVRLECGADGWTRIEGPFLAGEERTLIVPVPVRSPLGAEGLAAVPFPQVVLEPAAAAGRARLGGWASEQLASRLQRSAGELGVGARPSGRSLAARGAPAELAVVLAAGGFLLGLRRRFLACVLVALAAAGLAFALSRGRAGSCGEVELVQWQAGEEHALVLRVSANRLALDGERLEVVPAGRALEFHFGRDGRGGEVRAEGAQLTGLAEVPAPSLASARNDWQALAQVWTRSAGGEWSAHPEWGVGEALGPPRTGADPPGWLTGALPPGSEILVARSQGGAWVRCLGFAR